MPIQILLPTQKKNQMPLPTSLPIWTPRAMLSSIWLTKLKKFTTELFTSFPKETVDDDVSVAVLFKVFCRSWHCTVGRHQYEKSNHASTPASEKAGTGEHACTAQVYRMDSLLELDVSSSRNHAQNGRCAFVAGRLGRLFRNAMLNPVKHANADAA